MNKLNCCTLIKLDEYTPRPLPSLFPTEDFTDDFTGDVSSSTPRGTLNDAITAGPAVITETSVTETTPSKKTTTQPSTPPVSSNDGTTN